MSKIAYTLIWIEVTDRHGLKYNRYYRNKLRISEETYNFYLKSADYRSHELITTTKSGNVKHSRICETWNGKTA